MAECSSLTVSFSQVYKMLDQNVEFDEDGFVAFMKDEFEQEAPIPFQTKAGTLYARRSRTENSGWRLQAFDNPDDSKQNQRVGVFDVAMEARRVYVEHVYTVDAYKKQGVYSGLKGIFSEYLSQFNGKFCRGLTGELSPDGEAVAMKRNPEAEALRKLLLKLNVERSGDNPDPTVEISEDNPVLWQAFGGCDHV